MSRSSVRARLAVARKTHLRPPRLRSHDHDHERHATWLELFFDLVFVAAVAQIAAGLLADFTPSGLLEAFLLFLPIWWAWAGQTFYLTRFDSDDLTHRLGSFAQMGLIAALATTVPHALEGKAHAFAWCYAAVRAVLVFEYLRAGRHLPLAAPLTRFYATGFSLAAAIWIVSPFVADEIRPTVWGFAILIDLLVPVFGIRHGAKLPPHVAHIPERFGLFTIIVLGESIIALVAGLGQTDLDLRAALFAVLGILMIFAIWASYFDGIGAAERRPIGDRRGMLRFMTWMFAHLPLAFLIVVFAAALKKYIVDKAQTPFALWSLPVSLGLLWIMMIIIYLVTPSQRQNYERRFEWVYWGIAAAMILSGGLATLIGPWAVIASLCALAAFSVFFSLVTGVDLSGCPLQETGWAAEGPPRVE